VAAFIAAQRDEHGIPHAVVCRALGVSPAWFYKWARGDPSPRHARRARLGIEVGRLFAKHRGRYGSPRITADLREAGWRVRANTVAELMREQGLHARPKRRRRSTTRPGRGSWRASDLVGTRYFSTASRNLRRVSRKISGCSLCTQWPAFLIRTRRIPGNSATICGRSSSST
jgi:putative transposase